MEPLPHANVGRRLCSSGRHISRSNRARLKKNVDRNREKGHGCDFGVVLRILGRWNARSSLGVGQSPGV